MKLIVLVLFFAALFADVYIYRSVVCVRFRRLPARIGYIVFALLTDGVALSALALYSFSLRLASSGIIPVMWAVWVFFLFAIPKLIYAAGGLVDYLAGLATRRRVVVMRIVATALSVAVAGFMIGGATTGRIKTRTSEVEIASPRVPAAFDGYRLVQISDIHLGTMGRPEARISHLADQIAALKPDMVAVTGDIVNISNLDLTTPLIVALSQITAPDGVWTVWGNHDLGFYIKGADSLTLAANFEVLDSKVRAVGWEPLSNESVWIRRGGDSILLSGLNYPREMYNGHNNILGGADIDQTFAGVNGDPFSVVMSHSPVLWDDIVAAGRGDLTVAGHVHAMQLKFNIFGRQFSPAECLYDEWSGRYDAEGPTNKVLYVNDGIGCVGYPMRIGARPEITVFTLKRCE